MTLYEAAVNSRFKKLKIYQKHSGFWSDEGGADYSILNSYKIPTDEEISRIQLAMLKKYELLAVKKNQQAKQVNKFLIGNGQFINASSELQSSISHAIENIMSNIDNIKKSGGLSAKNRQKEYTLKNVQTGLKNIENSLRKLINAGVSVNGTYINELLNALNGIKAQGIPAETVNELMKNFFNLQGEVLEVLGTQFYNERMPKDIRLGKAIATGQLSVQGKQSITDILILKAQIPDVLKGQTITYKLKDTTHTVSLEEFLNLLESYSGRKQINISSTEMDKISHLVLSGIQAKSGVNQLPWNKNKKVNVYDLHPAFTLLNQLYHDSIPAWWSKGKYMNKTSSAYQALANYGLKDHLDTILSLSQEKNNFLLTRDGFVSYNHRITQLFQDRNSYFRVQGHVDISFSTRQMMSVII